MSKWTLPCSPYTGRFYPLPVSGLNTHQLSDAITSAPGTGDSLDKSKEFVDRNLIWTFAFTSITVQHITGLKGGPKPKGMGAMCHQQSQTSVCTHWAVLLSTNEAGTILFFSQRQPPGAWSLSSLHTVSRKPDRPLVSGHCSTCT